MGVMDVYGEVWYNIDIMSEPDPTLRDLGYLEPTDPKSIRSLRAAIEQSSTPITAIQKAGLDPDLRGHRLTDDEASVGLAAIEEIRKLHFK